MGSPPSSNATLPSQAMLWERHDMYVCVCVSSCMCADLTVTLHTGLEKSRAGNVGKRAPLCSPTSKALRWRTFHFNALLILVWILFPFPHNGMEIAPLHPSPVADLAKVRGETHGVWDWGNSKRSICISACSITVDPVSHSTLPMTSIQPRNMESMGNSREFRGRQGSWTLCPGWSTWQNRGMPKTFPTNQTSLDIPWLQLHCWDNELFVKTWVLLLSRTGGQVWGCLTFSSDEHSRRLFSGCWRPPSFRGHWEALGKTAFGWDC